MTTERNSASIKKLTASLRVPEFKYDLGEQRAKVLSIASREKLCSLWRQGEHESLAQLLREQAEFKPLPPEIINLAFVADRIFDVWHRKSALHEELNASLFPLRVIWMALSSNNPDDLDRFTQLIDRISGFCIGWMPHPERSKKIVLEALDQVMDLLRNTLSVTQTEEIWAAFEHAQGNKVERLCSRLIETERNLGKVRFDRCCAIRVINNLAKKRAMPDSVWRFVSEYSQILLQRAYGSKDAQVIEQQETLLKKLVTAYTTTGSQAFQLADSLLDELAEACDRAGLEPDNQVFQALEQDLLAVLQKQPLAHRLQKPVASDDALIGEIGQDKATLPTREWFISADGIRFKVAEVFPDSQLVLLTYYLGMKISIETVGEFSRRMAQREYRPLKPEATFERVLKTSINGLSKVAENQQKARNAAAVKARQEAELLLQEQKKAKLEAEQRAAEIAKRTQEIKLKQKEKKRLEREQEVRSVVTAMQLGAWIGVEKESSAPKERFKLAVKFAARQKYLFVDKLGIKKLEFSEDDLVAKLIQGTVEVLSNGAEFEDSLERVVSRIRMSK